MPPPVDETEGGRRFVTLREIMITLAGLVLVILTLVLGRASAMVVLITAANETLPFPDLEAGFAARVPSGGISGNFYGTYPSDACEPVINGPDPGIAEVPTFAIVERGGCKFDVKVLNAQAAGFDAVVIYNNEEVPALVSMYGSPENVLIPAVFVSKPAGEALLAYSKEIGARCYILPAVENTAWSVMAVSFISLLAVTAVLTSFLFVRRYRLRHLGSRLLLLRDSLAMSSREVRALPIVVFKCVGDGQGISETCAICLEDYEKGEKLRVLPCHHDFHAACVDEWLTTRRPFCPVCKRDAHKKSQVPPPSESTPLLASAAPPVPVPAAPVAPAAAPVASPATAHCRDVEAASQSSASPIGSPADEHEPLAFHSAPPDNFLSSSNNRTSGQRSPEQLC